MDPISSLPLLVRDKTFGFLKAADKVKAAQVCSTWRDTVLDPRHWRHEKVVVNLSQVREDGLCSVAERMIGNVKICGGEKSKMQYFLERHQSMVSLHLKSELETCFFLSTMSRGQFSSLTELTLNTDNNLTQTLSSQQALRMLSNLKRLSITGRMNNELIQAICSELGRLEELSMHSYTVPHVRLSIQGLAQLYFLHTLHLDFVNVEDFSRFCELHKTLRKLTLHWCTLGDDWVTELAKLTFLNKLNLKFCKPRADVLEPLSQTLVNLKKITVHRPEEGVVRSVGSLSTLEELDLPFSYRGNQYFHAVTDSLPHLKALTISGRSDITSEDLAGFGRIVTLQKLHLDTVTYSGCISSFLISLSQSQCRLKSMKLARFPMASRLDMEHIANISTLRELSLGELKEGRLRLMDLVHARFQLEVLELRDCKVTIEGLMPLLADQSSLRKLVIDEKEAQEMPTPSLHSVLPNLEVLLLKKHVDYVIFD